VKATTAGHLTVICGPMFASKTASLIRHLHRLTWHRYSIAVFKPVLDNRYHSSNIVSHDGVTLTAQPIREASEILHLADADVVGIDEAQFFDMGVVDVCLTLTKAGKDVFVAGLDLDFRGIPFGPMPHLLAIADKVDKVYAACTVCGDVATRSQRIVSSQEQVVVGGDTAYEARCIMHWNSDTAPTP